MSNFWSKWRAEIIIVLVFLAIFALAIYGVAELAQAQCVAQTRDIGFDSRWSLLGRCQIEVIEGQWIPLESYYFKQE